MRQRGLSLRQGPLGRHQGRQRHNSIRVRRPHQQFQHEVRVEARASATVKASYHDVFDDIASVPWTQ